MHFQHALLHPHRVPGVDSPLDLRRLWSLEFRPVDEARYPCWRLAQQALAMGGVAPAVFNAANEVAVAAFLAGRVPFLAIPQVIDETLAHMTAFEPTALAEVISSDAEARRCATRIADRLAASTAG